jgi:hypothetical protein
MAATTQTLPPLTREQKTAIDPRDNEDILEEARYRFTESETAEREEREQQYDALQFSSGQHWPSYLLQQRSQPGQEVPSLVIDRTYQYVSQILNSYRRAPLGLKIRPKSGGATQKLATILEGKCRDIEADSQAELAYTNALSQAISTGEGFFRLGLEYESPTSFQQCLKIRPIYDRFAVFCDPYSTHPAALDLEYAFIIERLSHRAFCAKYRRSPAEVRQWASYPDQKWVTPDEVQLAEYWYKVWTEEEIVQMPDGTILPTEGLGDLPPEWPTRMTRTCTVYGVTMCGYAILNKTRWPSSYIPIIRVEGRRLDMHGKTRRTGIVQASSSSQLAYDAYVSAEMSAIALTPKAPFVLFAETIAGYEQYWEKANDAHLPYLPVKAVVAGGQLLPAPRREVAEPAVQAITQARMMAAQDIQATVGQYEASVGAPSNEQSGAAIDARKREGEQTTAGFTANLAWSIEACGRQILDILPTLYPGATQLRQVGKDGTVSMAQVNQPRPDGQGLENALGSGVYECVVTTGPSYDTSREALVERLGILLGAVPQVAPYVLDLFVGNLDIPAAEQLAARLKSMVPPEALAQEESDDPATQLTQAQNALKQAQQQLQVVTQQLQESQKTSEVSVQQVKLLEQQVATMQTRLADKTRDLQLEMQKASWEHQIALHETQLKSAELQAKYGLQAAELAHDMQQPQATNGTVEEQ